MKTSKALMGLAVASVVALSATACSDGKTDGASDKDVSITWDMWSSGEDDAKWIKDTLAIAQKDNPNVEIKTQTPSWGDYYTKLTTNMASGNLACITSMTSGQLATFKSALSPLTEEDLKTAGINREDYAEGSFDMMTADGNLLAIPYDVAAMMVFYNEDLLAETNTPFPTNDWTFEDFLNTAKSATTDSHYAFAMSLDSAQWQALPMALSGTQLVNEKGELDATDPKWVEAATWYAELATKEKVASPVPSASDSDWGGSEFKGGNVAMYVEGTWTAANNFKKDFEAGAVRMPTGPNGSSGIVLGSGFGIAASCEGAEREAALKVLGSLIGSEAQNLLASSGRSYPAYIGAQDLYFDSFEEKVGAKLRTAFDAAFVNVTGLRTVDNWVQVSDYLEPNLVSVYTGQVPMATVLENVQAQFGK